MQFSCTAQQADGHVNITVVGDIDLAVHPQFQANAQAWAEKQADLVLDCSGVTFMDSMGLRVLVRLRHDVTQAGHALHLANPSGPVVRVLQLAGLNDLFPRVAQDPYPNAASN